LADSVVPDVIDYLVALFTADVTLGQAPAPNTVAVIDGPRLEQTPTQRNLYVGMTDPDADEPISANSEQEWAALGKQAVTETLTIHCCAEAWSGETDVRTLRLAAYGIVHAVEVLVRADPMLGGLVLFCEPVSGGSELRQDQTSQGVLVKVLFRIDAKARI
jgi:hypothetical protein